MCECLVHPLKTRTHSSEFRRAPATKARGTRGTSFSFTRLSAGSSNGGPRMRPAHVLAIALAMAASAALSLPASADRICREDCIGPLCNKNCVHRDRDVTVGRGVRDRDVIIEERPRVREPGVEIRRSRPGVDVEIE